MNRRAPERKLRVMAQECLSARRSSQRGAGALGPYVGPGVVPPGPVEDTGGVTKHRKVTRTRSVESKISRLTREIAEIDLHRLGTRLNIGHFGAPALGLSAAMHWLDTGMRLGLAGVCNTPERC